MNDKLANSQRRSKVHEQRVADVLGGRRIPGSGSLGEPGDVKHDLLLLECKLTDKRCVSVELEWIEKISREAEESELTPALALELSSLEDGVEKDWVLLPLRVAAALLRERT